MAEVKISEAINIEAVRFKESSAPATPASGYGKVYAKTDGLLYWKDDAGNERPASFGEGARVYNSSDISINNASTTALTFNSERYDTDGIHDTGSNTDRLTCQTAGKYYISGSVQFASNSSGFRQIFIYLNGTTLLSIHSSVAITGDGHRLSISTAYDLAANDYVTLLVYQNSGGALNVNSAGNYSPEFMMHRIG